MLASCSTTRVLADGECRLARNEVHIGGDAKLNAGNLSQYVKQKPNSSPVSYTHQTLPTKRKV